MGSRHTRKNRTQREASAERPVTCGGGTGGVVKSPGCSGGGNCGEGRGHGGSNTKAPEGKNTR
jgi:hypothetical protein